MEEKIKEMNDKTNAILNLNNLQSTSYLKIGNIYKDMIKLSPDSDKE